VFAKDLLVNLYRHMEWADARMWAAVPADTSDERLKGLLVHVHVVQRAFLMVWTGGDSMTVFRTPDDFADLAAVHAWARPYYAEAHALISGATDDQFSQPMTMPWAAEVEKAIGRPPGITTFGDTCFQVTSHTTHHRAQINARLRELWRCNASSAGMSPQRCRWGSSSPPSRFSDHDAGTGVC
jgi:uncharacterized damage-inducible protein DinB